MTKLEEMAKAAWEQAQLQIPEAHRLMDWGLVPSEAKKNFIEFVIAALKVLREANTAMKTAGVVSKDRYGSVADIFESMIDAVLAEAPK